jgi:hypothetical protein
MRNQVIFGGSYSNYTKERVLTESSLIGVYHTCHANIERNFQLGGLTTRHTPPDMRNTYKVLSEYMHTQGTNTYRAGRKTAHSIPDVFNKGLAVLLQGEDATQGREGKDRGEVNVLEEDVMGDF